MSLKRDEGVPPSGLIGSIKRDIRSSAKKETGGSVV